MGRFDEREGGPTEENWWDDRTMPNDDGPDWVRDENGELWQVDPKTGKRIKWPEPKEN